MNELKLVKNKLGFYRLIKWTMYHCSTQLSGIYGIYIIVNIKNWKYQIGEGLISKRILSHLTFSDYKNKKFGLDLIKFGKESFRLIGYIPENNLEKRKEIEYYLHKFYAEKCYNQPRPPKSIIQKLIDNGMSKHQIKEHLQCSRECLDKYIKKEQTSDKSVSYDKSRNRWRSSVRLINGSIDKIFRLGNYKLETEASQNKDYFVVKNNLLDRIKLNHHDVDYSKFKPHVMINGKINKYLK